MVAFFIFFPLPAHADILLKVKVKNVEYTNVYPGTLEEEVPFYFWFIYEAKVLQVIEGEYTEKTIKFANVQHTYYIKRLLNEVYVVIDEFDDPEMIDNLGVKYFSTGRLIFPQTMVCLPESYLKHLEEKYESDNEEAVSDKDYELYEERYGDPTKLESGDKCFEQRDLLLKDFVAQED